MKVFILLCAIGAAFAAEVCPDNSHYESCGTACPLTCENYHDPPEVCVMMCVSGCFCDEGFVKAIDGRCVRSENCPAIDEAVHAETPSCPANSHYESCGTACPLTCDNYNDPPVACVLMCNPGCHCDEGYVKTHDDKCVKPEHCPARDPPACDENSHYLECGTACPLTCDNYLNPPKICPLMCVSGCHCMKGFVKTEDGHCVRPEQCPSYSVRPKEPSCFGEPDTGNCRAYIPMYYYDIKDGTCKKFIYGGCDGSGNRYVTEKDCLAQCEGVQERSSSACELPAEAGVCRGFFPRFYYDAVLGKCSEFVYGGCGGNENNFETVEECQQTCGQQSAPQMAFDKSECQKIPETGPCHGNFYRYYFDKSNKECKPFIYGGCQGNGNNFETEEECKKSCGVSFAPSACDQELVVGPCRAYFPRYFFNKQTGRCERFIYGGCQGNENNYLTQEECEAECVA